MNTDADRVFIVGAGLAGLAAARALSQRGIPVHVFESSDRVGGRMTTDRINGFVIDRGVTLLGREFTRMKRLIRELNLSSRAENVMFNVAIDNLQGSQNLRARYPFDVFVRRDLSSAAKFAFLKLACQMLYSRQKLGHGANNYYQFENQVNCLAYLSRFGRGGKELYDRIFGPVLGTAVGGELSNVCSQVMLQTIWNIAVQGVWNISGGVDQLPEAMAKTLPVSLNSKVLQVRFEKSGVSLTVEENGVVNTSVGRGVIFAVPGQLVPALCPSLPESIKEPLSATRFASIASVHLAIPKALQQRFSVLGFSQRREDAAGVIEFENVRAPGSCPLNNTLLSVYFPQSDCFNPLAQPESELATRALRAVRQSCGDNSLPEPSFSHCIKWPIGVPLIDAQRLKVLSRLREQIELYEAPIDFCGDFMDGPSSEGALATGEIAAQRICSRMKYAA